VEELKRQLQPKRERTDDDAGDAHEVLAEVENWDRRDYRQQATRVQNRRNVQVGSRQYQAKPRTGTDGFFHHTRLGLVGWISYWCLGDSALAVDIVRVAEIVVRELEKAKPDKWGCVHARDLWSPQEERQVHPGHFWLLKFGKVPGSNSCVEKEFKLATRKYEEYKDVRFGNGDCTLVFDVWLHRVDEDALGLTFEEWDPSADTDASEAPVAMIVNSSELRAAGFDLREVIPLQPEAVARGARRTRGAALKQILGMGTRRYVLSVNNDNEFRSRCE
jgi:hypothetical protein